MFELRGFGIMLANNNRAKSYLQNLIRVGLKPSSAIYFDTEGLAPEQTYNDQMSPKTSQENIVKYRHGDTYFNEKEHVLKTLNDYQIPYEVVSKGVNDQETIDVISKLNESCFVYAGPGGVILSEELLHQVKVFLHVHPGILPENRGSTTIYYSLLRGEKVGCSVIAFRPQIDQGPIYFQETFDFDSLVDPDYHFDPLVRTQALVNFFKKNYGKILSPLVEQNKEDGVDHYIIHPVLKQIALIKGELNVK